MFSIHFCVCFYMVLYVCFHDNCTAEITTKGIGKLNIRERNFTQRYTSKIPTFYLKNNNNSANYVNNNNERIIFRTKDNVTHYKNYNKQKKYVQNNIDNREILPTVVDNNNVIDYWDRDRDENKFYKNITLLGKSGKKTSIKNNDKTNIRNASLILRNVNEKERYYETNKSPKENTKKKLTINYRNNEDLYQDIDYNVIPLIQKRIDNDAIKKSLDEFTMARRKTHFTLPDMKYNSDISVPDTDYTDYQEVRNPNAPNDMNIKYKTKINDARTDFESDYYTNEITPKYNYLYPTYEEEANILNVLRKQTNLIKKLAQTIIEMDGRRRIDDFSKLIAEVAAKQKEYKKSPNYTAFTFETTTTTTTTKPTKLTTIITVIDETNVRNALKNDPHVKRILKMASKKRDKYLKNARKYFKQYIF